MFTVVKIGGCNGSGKTSLARAVMAHVGGMKPCEYLRPGKPAAYHMPYGEANFYMLGSYENVCGGMDTISDKETRFGLVEGYSKNGRIVFFEGLITGKTYGALGALSDTKKHKGKWLYVMMDTPWEVCVERVLTRRKAAGNDAPFDPERTMRPTFKSIHSTARRAEEAGHRVIWVNHKLKPHTAAKKLVEQALEHYREG